MGVCRFRLEVRDRHHATQFQCELPDGHDGLCRSILLTPGYEKGFVVEVLDDPEPDQVPVLRKETDQVLVVWR